MVTSKVVYNAAFCREARRSSFWQPVVSVDRDEIRKAIQERNKSLHSHSETAGPSSRAIPVVVAEDISIVSLFDSPRFSPSASFDTESLNTILIELEDEDEGVPLPETIPAEASSKFKKHLEVKLTNDDASEQKMEEVAVQFSQIRPTGTGGEGSDTGPSFLIVNKIDDESLSVNPKEIKYTTIQFPFGRIFLDPSSDPDLMNIFLSWIAFEHCGGNGVNFNEVAATRSNVVLGRIKTAAECPEESARRCICRREPFPFIAGSFPLKLKHVASFETPKVINSAVMTPPPILKEKDAAVTDAPPTPTPTPTGSSPGTSEPVRAKVYKGAPPTRIPMSRIMKAQFRKSLKKLSCNSDIVEENVIPLIEQQQLDKGVLRALASVRNFQKKEESKKRWLAKREELLARNPVKKAAQAQAKNLRAMRSANNKNDDE